MNKPAQLTFALLIAVASARAANAQVRTRDNRKYRQYNEENAGSFPKGESHTRKTNSVKTKKKPGKETKTITETTATPKQTRKKSQQESYYYGGLLLGIGAMPNSVNGNPQLQFDYNYSGSSTANSYNSSVQGSSFSSYFPEFYGGVEAGKINGMFLSLNFGGSDHNQRDVFNFDITIGRNYLLSNNHWKISPSVSIGVVGSNITLPQPIDNHQDVEILGREFPSQYTSNNQTKTSDEIKVRLNQESGLLRFQCSASPRIGNNFPIRLTLGYNLFFGSKYNVFVQSPAKREQFSWNDPGMTLTNPGYDPSRLCSYQGLYFQFSFYIQTARWARIKPITPQ